MLNNLSILNMYLKHCIKCIFCILFSPMPQNYRVISVSKESDNVVKVIDFVTTSLNALNLIFLSIDKSKEYN